MPSDVPDHYDVAAALLTALGDATELARAATDQAPDGYLGVLNCQSALIDAAQTAQVAGRALEDLVDGIVNPHPDEDEWAIVSYDPDAPDASKLGFVDRRLPAAASDELV